MFIDIAHVTCVWHSFFVRVSVIVPTLSQNDPKMVPRMAPACSQHGPKHAPNTVPKLSHIGPTMVTTRSPTWSHTWSQHGPKMAPTSRGYQGDGGRFQRCEFLGGHHGFVPQQLRERLGVLRSPAAVVGGLRRHDVESATGKNNVFFNRFVSYSLRPTMYWQPSGKLKENRHSMSVRRASATSGSLRPS